MFVQNLTNLGQFCVLLSTGQGKVYRPTNMYKAIYPASLKEGYKNISYLYFDKGVLCAQW